MSHGTQHSRHARRNLAVQIPPGALEKASSVPAIPVPRRIPKGDCEKVLRSIKVVDYLTGGRTFAIE